MTSNGVREETDVSQGWPCKRCGSSFKHPRQLIEHLERTHGIDRKRLTNDFALDAANAERAAKKRAKTQIDQPASEIELAYATYVPGDETVFKCLQCDAVGRRCVLQKSSAEIHFQRVHRLEKWEMEHWSICVEGRQYARKTKRIHPIFKNSILAAGKDEGDQMMEDHGDGGAHSSSGGDGGGGGGCGSVGGARGSGLQVEQARRDLGAAPTINSEVKKWDPATWVRCSKKFPQVTNDVVLDGRFARFLKQDEGCQSAEDSEMYIKRFLGAFDAHGYDYNGPELLVAIYKHDLVAELRDLPLFSTDRTWSIKIAQALRQWCAWHADLLEMSDDGRDIHMRAKIHALERKARRWAHVCQPAKRARARRHKRAQATLIKQMPGAEAINVAAQQAMRDLENMARRYASKPTITYRDQAYATTALGGLVYSVTVGGRDGEWKYATEEHVREELFVKDLNYLIMEQHKTVAQLGEAVKHIPNCLKRAFEMYFALPKYKRTLRAFRPVKGDHVSFSSLLRLYSARYLPSYQPFGVNLVRKRLTRDLLLAAGVTAEKLDALKVCHKHSGPTALQHYFALTWEEEAAICAKAYKLAIGEPPNWPEEGREEEDCVQLRCCGRKSDS